MPISEWIFNCKYHDLNPIYFGKSTAELSTGTGIPHTTIHSIIHYVEKGSGFFIKNGVEYRVQAGDFFTISDGDFIRYFSDSEDFWTLIYIGFDGNLSKNFTKLPDVFRDENNFLKDFDKISSYNGNKAALLTSHLFRWHSNIITESQTHPNDYVSFAKKYINENDMENITVEEIASVLGISRSYLLRLFKKETGRTVQEYIISTKVKMGRKFIENGKSIKEAAFLSGFSNFRTYSRCYKRYYCKLPSQYKNEIKQKVEKIVE